PSREFHRTSRYFTSMRLHSRRLARRNATHRAPMERGALARDRLRLRTSHGVARAPSESSLSPPRPRRHLRFSEPLRAAASDGSPQESPRCRLQLQRAHPPRNDTGRTPSPHTCTRRTAGKSKIAAASSATMPESPPSSPPRGPTEMPHHGLGRSAL